VNTYVGITDLDWFRFLSSRPDIDEANFWQPGGSRQFRALHAGEPFLFKLHAPRNYIVGGGTFAYSTILPVSLAWDAFGEKNGVSSLPEMRARLARYRRAAVDPLADYSVGCIMLEQPFFLEEQDWIPAPADFARNLVQGKTYDLATGEGKRLWERVLLEAGARAIGERQATVEPLLASEGRYGAPTLMLPRLGQGSFRVIVTDAYDRRCSMTGERTLPVLQAAHIRPYGLGGPHDPRNGLLLRSDLHTLFDRGYVTVTPELKVEVSNRIREEFENGRDYYKLHGQPLREPVRAQWRPSRDFLDWHASQVYRG
jgi:putative restriction endonuclease